MDIHLFLSNTSSFPFTLCVIGAILCASATVGASCGAVAVAEADALFDAADFFCTSDI